MNTNRTEAELGRTWGWNVDWWRQGASERQGEGLWNVDFGKNWFGGTDQNRAVQ